VTAWLAAHRVKDVGAAFSGEDEDIALDDCTPLAPIDRHDAIRCPRQRTEDGLLVVRDEVWLLDRRASTRTEGAKLRRVLSVPVTAGLLLDEGSAEMAPLRPVKLRVSFDDSGKWVDVSDDTGVGCDQAYARYRELYARSKLEAALASFKRQVDFVCGARGRYTYRKGAFHGPTPSTAADPLKAKRN
jgi:hypothetical protein